MNYITIYDPSTVLEGITSEKVLIDIKCNFKGEILYVSQYLVDVTLSWRTMTSDKIKKQN